ncbi:MAG: sulfatase [bacterium]|nr:sulfatase [bacterium]
MRFRSGWVILASAVVLLVIGAVILSQTHSEYEMVSESVDLICPLLAGSPVYDVPQIEGFAARRDAGCGTDKDCYYAGGDDRRRSLLLSPGTTYKASIEVPKSPQSLRFSYQVLQTGSCESNVGFSVTLGGSEDEDDGGDIHWQQTVIPQTSWTDVDIDLSQVKHHELSVEVSAFGQGECLLAFGMPRIIARTERGSAAEQASRPNVMVYLVDTLRPDHMSLYGYERETTPRIDEYFADDLVFMNAYSTASWTRPATASLLTSLYPSFHGANVGGIADEVRTLAERLRAAGWSTWAFITNGNVFAEDLAFDQGFDQFVTIHGVKNDNHATSEEVNTLVLRHLEAHSDEPFFLFIHTVDPHMPYNPPQAYRGLYTDMEYDGQVEPKNTKRRYLRKMELSERDRLFIEGLYDEDIRYQDEMFGELIEGLESLGLDNEVLTLLTSDHGEEFFEHGDWGHGKRLYEEVIRIPLMIRLPPSVPQREQGQVESPVQLIDIAPTLCEWLGVPDVEGQQGLNLASTPPSSELDANRSIYCEEPRTKVAWYSLKEGPTKLIVRNRIDRGKEGGLVVVGESEYQLFNLDEDPLERDNLTKRSMKTAQAMSLRLLELVDELRRHTEMAAQTDEPTLDERTRRHLEALGYIDN